MFNQQNTAKLEKYLGVKNTPGEHEIRLLEKVAKYNALFQKIPGILCICVCNSLAMNACHKGSDIDLFVITKPHRLWTARIFLTLALSILGQRKTSKKHAEKLCLSFFISEENLSLENIAIENDIYLSYWVQTLKPVLNRRRVFERFMEVNSPLSGILSPLEEKGATICSLISPPREKIVGGFLGNLLESLLKAIFLPRTKKSFQKLGKPFGVEITDTMLKFHDKDRRKEIRNFILK
ncbi:nucleotidyltransferase domain-containing protein [Candidatus Gracilibacteria bacterium]|nr:nucleotidyltransferase domain-containing protein [Candidatus Gracilibacteria bacterium]